MSEWIESPGDCSGCWDTEAPDKSIPAQRKTQAFLGSVNEFWIHCRGVSGRNRKPLVLFTFHCLLRPNVLWSVCYSHVFPSVENSRSFQYCTVRHWWPTQIANQVLETCLFTASSGSIWGPKLGGLHKAAEKKLVQSSKSSILSFLSDWYVQMKLWFGSNSAFSLLSLVIHSCLAFPWRWMEEGHHISWATSQSLVKTADVDPWVLLVVS